LSGSHPIAPTGILAGSTNPHTYPADPSNPDAQTGVGAGEKRSDPQSVIGRISASLHPNPENPARSTWSTQSDWPVLQSVRHACVDEAELGSIGVETFDTAYCYCPVVKELGLGGLRRQLTTRHSSLAPRRGRRIGFVFLLDPAFVRPKS
jgi:hypothetical protein